MASIHKNVKGLKRDGILLLLVDLAVIVLAMTSDTGIILPTEELYSLMLEFAIAILFDLWWVWDSKSWISGNSHYVYSGIIRHSRDRTAFALSIDYIVDEINAKKQIKSAYILFAGGVYADLILRLPRQMSLVSVAAAYHCVLSGRISLCIAPSRTEAPARTWHRAASVPRRCLYL